MAQRLLIVEDDKDLALMVKDFLEAEGFDVHVETTGVSAAKRIVNDSFDAVVLDIGLPEMDGISICRQVRAKFDGPIVMLTARGDEIDEVVALEVGADDFMTKPVRPRALLTRLKMHLRRSELPVSDAGREKLVIADLTVDAGSRTVSIGDKLVSLTSTEFDLLWYLATRAGQVVKRTELYSELVGLPYDGLDRSIDLRVSRLRRKLGDDSASPTRIKSVRGVGYILAR